MTRTRVQCAPMPAYPGHRAVLAVLAVTWLGACSQLITSPDIRFTAGETPVLVRETGAIIVARRQVGNVKPGGKIVDSRGRTLAFLHGNNVRLRGGIALTIKTDRDGSFHIPEDPQRQAGLTPVVYRVRPDGSMAQTRGAQGIPIKGPRTDDTRRLVLLILLLTANSMWS